MPRVALDLNNAADRQKVKSEWKVGEGFVPGEPNEGLTARLLASPPREADFDDSGWSVCADIRKSLSVGFTFAWYRTTVELPLEVNNMPVEGARLWFETNVDNYGEVYIDGKIDRTIGVVTGNNVNKRVLLEDAAVPGQHHLIAVLVANAPLGEPVGTIFMRFATLAFE